MAGKTVLTGEKRKRSIIKAARPLFAEKGFHGTSVREIAKAAGVSEALIYKHFTGKEDIHDELLDYAREMLRLGLTGLDSIQYGARTLVLLVFVVVEVIMLYVPGRIPDQKMHERLLFQNLMGGTVFARSNFKMLQDNWADIVNECFEAAIKEGDIAPATITSADRMLFVHHLAMALNLCHLSGEATFKYEVSREKLAEEAVLFCLKGIGMTDEANRSISSLRNCGRYWN
ncbi:MAG: helix-turn-helix domain-containing protein [Actinomycetota bacterium]|nr:helix-turn-helix domain-containing protein [Actinomycetota bacterium]